jgi:aminoglycoside phosphotransferase family enzyme/predicted kinase
VSRIEVIETHISTVLLTGEFAYKIKKPVDLGFLDFTTLERRRRCCEDEVRLNRRTAPGIYIDVVPIGGTLEHPVVGSGGPAIEYAVRMRQFAPDSTLDALLQRGTFSPAHVDDLASSVAAFHARIAVASPETRHGSPERVWAAVLDNFRQISAHEGDTAELARLQTWSEAEFAGLRGLLEERRRGGFVRECHGDLHLRNVALIDGRPVPFDCIEFSDALRWIDVISEVAFSVMDLLEHGARALAFRFLNGYLEASGDYAGVALLRFYLVYRALVRAKIAAIRAGQPDLQRQARMQARDELEQYVRLAGTLTERGGASLLITSGVSGSGKTSVARSLAESLGAIGLRSDVERKRLHGLAATARTGAGIGAGLYGPDASAATYGRLAELARALLPSRFPVIVDAAFLRRTERDALRKVAREAGAQFLIVACNAPPEVLRERVLVRERVGQDASEATVAVLERQIETREPLAPEELADAIACEASAAAGSAALLGKVRARLVPRTDSAPS